MTFYGNPNAKITAIDASGGISCSRTSGQTPCPIMACASEITCTGTIVDTAGNDISGHVVAPFQDLEYRWDFGDPSSTDTMIVRGGPRRGVTVNTNNGQIGPMAVHWYRSAGTYTITLTVRGKNGSGFTTETKTQDVTVTAFSASGGTFYFDSIGGSDANDGLSSGAPKQSISAINTALANDRLILLKCGSSWVGTTGITFDHNRLRIEAYGSGANPIVNISSGTNSGFNFNIGGSATTTRGDLVVSNIDFYRTGSASNAIIKFLSSDPNATIANIYFDGCNILSDNSSGTANFWVSFSWGGGGTDGSLISNFGIRGGSISASATDTARALGFFGGARNWNFFTAIDDVSGTGLDPVRDHHFYPDLQNNVLFQCIKFGSGTDRSYCLNCNWDTESGALEIARYWVISECELTGTDFAHDASDQNGEITKVQYNDFVVERNDMHDLRVRGCLFFNIASATWRDNRAWNVPSSIIDPGTNLAGLLVPRIYRNYNYRTSDPNATAVFNFANAAFTQPKQITDNVTQDVLAAAKCIGVRSASEQSANTLIDRDQYWIPTDADSKGWFDNATANTFAQWQAFGFDVNGSVADPVWLDPANGDFTPLRRRVRLTATA